MSLLGNGFLEGEELDKFLKEFCASVCSDDVGTEVVSGAMLEELKQDFMDAYDENGDGRIEIREVFQETKKNFGSLIVGFRFDTLACRIVAHR